MLIPFHQVQTYLKYYNIEVCGILHVGAHECEELADYVRAGVSADKIIWVEGNKEKVLQMKAKGVPNVYQGMVSDHEGEVTFYVTNNGQSSSILELGTHKTHHPKIYVTQEQKHQTTTLQKLFETHSLDASKYNFWNFDIQGAELLALHGAGSMIDHVDACYMEVNEEELYKGGALISELDIYFSEHGFKRIATTMTEYKWGDALYVRASTC